MATLDQICLRIKGAMALLDRNVHVLKMSAQALVSLVRAKLNRIVDQSPLSTYLGRVNERTCRAFVSPLPLGRPFAPLLRSRGVRSQRSSQHVSFHG